MRKTKNNEGRKRQRTRARTRTLSTREWNVMRLALRLAKQHLEALLDSATTDGQVAPGDPSAVEVARWRRQLARLGWLQTHTGRLAAGGHAASRRRSVCAWEARR
jgi:hypothetical protein